MKMTDFLVYHPLSEQYLEPPGKTAKELVTLLIARQKKTYGMTILESGLPRAALTKHMKTLMKKYTLNEIKRGIDLTVLTSEHPASTKFIEEMILWRKELMSYHPYPVSKSTPLNKS